ncbi:hypothetical protein [Ornithinimicrobium kibberense]|uniref:hypothetical protein n=1 Tax=Ornithinimicrobium kibberense TaxID=282060 RepID=UPI00361C0C58
MPSSSRIRSGLAWASCSCRNCSGSIMGPAAIVVLPSRVGCERSLEGTHRWPRLPQQDTLTRVLVHHSAGLHSRRASGDRDGRSGAEPRVRRPWRLVTMDMAANLHPSLDVRAVRAPRGWRSGGEGSIWLGRVRRTARKTKILLNLYRFVTSDPSKRLRHLRSLLVRGERATPVTARFTCGGRSIPRTVQTHQ